MASAWQTLEEAALTLGISSRTLHRRIARGEFQTRLENGRREVLVTIEANVSDESAAQKSPVGEFDHACDTRHDDVSHPSDDVRHAVLALHEDRIRRTDLAIMAYQQSVTTAAGDARRAHRNSRIAWTVAGGLTVALFLSVTWATHSVTAAKADVTHLSQSVRQLSDTADARGRDSEKLRQDAETARIAAARAEGQLSAVQARLDQLARERDALQAKFIITATTQPSATTQPTGTSSASR